MTVGEEDEKTIIEKWSEDMKDSNIDPHQVLNDYRLEYDVINKGQDILLEDSESAVFTMKKINRNTPKKTGEGKSSLKFPPQSYKRSSEKSLHERERTTIIKQRSTYHTKTPKYNNREYNREYKMTKTFSCNYRPKIRFPENAVFENGSFQSRKASFCRRPILKKVNIVYKHASLSHR
jgi:hypothetical protein